MNIKNIKQSFIIQNDQSDCGVACLLSLTNYYSGTITLEKLRELSGTTKQGTTLLGLYQAANQIGFDAEGNEAGIKSLIEHGEPVILHVLMNQRLQHFVICYGYEEDHFIIGDPGKGIQNYSKKELEKIWVSRTCLTLKPSKNFNNRIINFFYGSLLFLPKSFFDTRRIGELVARLNDITRIQRVITEIAGSIIIDSLMALISLTFIFIYSREAGIIVTVTLPFYFLLIYRYNHIIITSQKEVMVAYAHSESNYISTMQGVAAIKNLNKQNFFSKNQSDHLW